MEKITKEELAKLPEKLRSSIQHPDVVAVFKEPDSLTSRELHYECGGIDLLQGKKIIIILPENIKGIVKDVILAHRKREAYWNLPPGGDRKDHDPAGAYSRIRVFDSADTSWKDWQDPKGYDPIKYAERRADLEYENLHDWYGTVGNIHPQAVEIMSAGNDPKWSVPTIYSLDVVTYPEISPKSDIIEHIFTTGTSFVDLRKQTQKLPTYGGGKDKGAYPHAVPLAGKNGKEHFEMTESIQTPKEYLDEKKRLHIVLPTGSRMKSLELAIGDTWFNYKGPGKLQLGWSKLNAYLITKHGKKDKFMDTVNIPPQGILLGGPTDQNYITQEGDEIVIESYPTSYLMGWRIIFETPTTITEIDDKVKSTHKGMIKGIEEEEKKPLKLVSTHEKAGTQGGEWYKDELSGDYYFGKDYQGNLDRCATEYIVNTIYKIMQVPAVESVIFDQKVFSKKVEGELFPREKKHDKTKVKDYFSHPDINKGFVVDAWLANWDIFGLDYDNIIKTPDNRMLRTDAGGCLFYRAMGSHKESFGKEDTFGNIPVTEIETMRDAKYAREAGIIFEKITNEEIKSQIQELVATMTDGLIEKIVKSSGISNSEKIIHVLIKRRDWLGNEAKTIE